MKFLRAAIPLLVPLTFSTGCTRVREIRIPVAAECDPGDPPDRPALHWHKCGTEVCLTPDDAVALWRYERDRDRHDDVVRACLDTRDSP